MPLPPVGLAVHVDDSPAIIEVGEAEHEPPTAGWATATEFEQVMAADLPPDEMVTDAVFVPVEA